MNICQRQGSYSPYFRASKKNRGHVENCGFKNSNNDFDPANYDEDAFSFDDAIGNLWANNVAGQNKQGNVGNHGDGEPQAHPLRTLRQIYFMCKSIPIEETYAGKHIYEMILDDRSVAINGVDFVGNKIIEAHVKMGEMLYYKDLLEIHLWAPLKSDSYHIILRFDDEKLFLKIKNEIYENNEKIIVVAGNWEKLDAKILQTNFLNKKQLYIHKNG